MGFADEELAAGPDDPVPRDAFTRGSGRHGVARGSCPAA